MSRLAIIASALLLTGSGTALAQAPAPAATPSPPTRADVEKSLDANFDKADVNNDGFITRDEMQNLEAQAIQKARAQIDAKAAEQFSKLDKDKNGQLSLEEFKAGLNVNLKETPDQLIANFDKNKDGKISAAELKAPMLARFDAADTNKDGKLSPEEQAKAK